MKDLIQILAAALAPIIAVLGIYVAWRQHKLQREELRLDLYEKRFAVFQALMEFLRITLRDAKVPLARYFEYRTNTAQSVFLFGSEISSYLEEVGKKALKFRELNERLAADAMPMGASRAELAEEESELLSWLSEQPAQAQSLFAKYIAFTKL